MNVSGISKVADVHNQSAPGALTNILTDSLTPKFSSAYRITILLAVSSIFYVTITRSGTTFLAAQNSGTALVAGASYTFTIGVNPSNTYNFQVATNGVIQVLQVDEVSAGVI